MLMHRRKPAAMGWQCRNITITAVLLLRCTIFNIISIISKNGEEVFKPTSSRHLGRKYSVNLCYIIAIHELLNLHRLRFEIVYIHQSTLSCTAEARTVDNMCISEYVMYYVRYRYGTRYPDTVPVIAAILIPLLYLKRWKNIASCHDYELTKS